MVNMEDRIRFLREQKAYLLQKLDIIERAEESRNPSLLKICESELERAEIVIACKDILKKLQEMAEDLAKMMAHDLMPLNDTVTSSFGPEVAQKFEQSTGAALNTAIEGLKSAKDGINMEVLRMEGKISDEDIVPPNDMATGGGFDSAPGMGAPAAGGMDPGMDPGAMPPDDTFGGADAAAGEGDAAMEPLGRETKESRVYTRKVLESLMGWIIAESATRMTGQDLAKFAQKLTEKAQENPRGTVDWLISKRKIYEAGGMALANPASLKKATMGLGAALQGKKPVPGAPDAQAKDPAAKKATSNLVKSNPQLKQTLDRTGVDPEKLGGALEDPEVDNLVAKKIKTATESVEGIEEGNSSSGINQKASSISKNGQYTGKDHMKPEHKGDTKAKSTKDGLPKKRGPIASNGQNSANRKEMNPDHKYRFEENINAPVAATDTYGQYKAKRDAFEPDFDVILSVKGGSSGSSESAPKAAAATSKGSSGSGEDINAKRGNTEKTGQYSSKKDLAKPDYDTEHKSGTNTPGSDLNQKRGPTEKEGQYSPKSKPQEPDYKTDTAKAVTSKPASKPAAPKTEPKETSEKEEE